MPEDSRTKAELLAEIESLKRETARLRAAEQRLIEQIIDISEIRLAQILDYLPDPTWAIDKAGRVLAWNKAMEKLTGIPAEDMIGKGDYEYALPFYGERRPVLVDLVIQRATGIENRYRRMFKDGPRLEAESFHPNLGDGGVYLMSSAQPLFNAAGEVVGAVESVRDITAIKRTEVALKEGEERLRDILDNLPGVGVVARDEKGDIVWVNRELKKLTGYDDGELLGDLARVMDRLIPDKMSQVELAERLGELGNDYRDFEVEIRCKNGEAKIFFLSSISSRLPISGFARWAVAIDVTERKRAEADLKRRLKLEGAIAMAGATCHELNQPLQAVVGQCELLLRKLSDDRELASRASMILEQIERLGEVIARIQSITTYETAGYPGGARIIDLKRAVRNEP